MAADARTGAVCRTGSLQKQFSLQACIHNKGTQTGLCCVLAGCDCKQLLGPSFSGVPCALPTNLSSPGSVSTRSYARTSPAARRGTAAAAARAIQDRTGKPS